MANTTRNTLRYTLPNPFRADTASASIGHVSGRRTDISEMIMSKQSAIILAGAPRIGKSTLIRYLQQEAGDGWSWRDEVAELRNWIDLKAIHFSQVNLAGLADKTTPAEQLVEFVKACIQALKQVIQQVAHIPGEETNLRSLRMALRQAIDSAPNARYFVVLDAIDRLGKVDASTLIAPESGISPQDQGLAFLVGCKAIRVLVDLIDEFDSFGVVLVIKNLPRPRVDSQFSQLSPNLSDDLARFKTITLQTFTWEDAGDFLAQPPEGFGEDWASLFKETISATIFTAEEQAWLLEQAGTSPYLLQQFCYQAFYLKSLASNWAALADADKRQIIEKTNEQLNTFFLSIWKRLQESLEQSSQDTRVRFAEFIHALRDVKSSQETIEPGLWTQLGLELRYILYSEGIVRFDPRQPIHYPGSSLRKYLIQKFEDNPTWFGAQNLMPGIARGFSITIARPDFPPKRLALSELEYLLLKTLKQHPSHCKEETLMKGAWGNLIPRATFSQRMFQLRKRLKEQCDTTEIIENHYGGEYSLNHPEWFLLE